MALDFSAGQLEFTVPNPTDTVTDFSFVLLLTRASHGDFFDACTVENAAQMRLCKGDETTELAFDPIDEDWTTDAESILLRVKWSGSLTSTGSYTLIALPALSTNTAYSATDTYGQYNAYGSDIYGYYPLVDGDDRTVNQRTLTAQGGLTFGGAVGPLGDATQFTGSDYAQIGADIDTTVNDWSVTALTLFDNTDSDKGIFGSTSQRPQSWLDNYSTSDRFAAFGGSGVAYGTTVISSDMWYGYGARFDIDGTTDVYTNGTDKQTATTALIETAATLVIGRSSGKYNVGRISHFMLSTIIQSDACIAYEYSQTSDNSTFWGTSTWVSGDTSTNFTGGIDQDQTIAGAFKVKIPFTGGSEQAQTIAGALSIISQSTDFTGGVSQGQIATGELLLKTKFSGGISQGQTIAGQVEIIAAETNFTGGISQSQENSGEQKIVLSFDGGVEQGQTVSGTLKVIGADTNFSGGVSQTQEISGQVTVTDNSIQFTGGITQGQDVAGEFSVVIPPAAFSGGSEQDQDVSGYFRSHIEITPDVITVNGEIQRALTITGTIQRTLAIKGELV